MLKPSRRGVTMSRHPALAYRPDIDGLRAVAVIAVLLFHYRFAPVWGGFAGVDVFFVISGFLITTIIRRDMANGEFSLASFYDRRVRRIVPALFAMVAIVVAATAIIFLPADFRRFAQSAGALAVFMSNMEFWRELGYFDVNGQAKPLLHTWSVSVEEQYYLFFPLLLLALRSLRVRAALLVVGLLFCASLFFCIWCAVHAPSVGFFWIFPRFWQLALGAILAMAPVNLSNRLCSMLGVAALAVMVLAFGFLNARLPYPGYLALVPSLAAAALIASGQKGQGPAYRLLALPPLVWVGRISYSLYLWHWPLWVLLTYFIGHIPTLPERLALILLSFLLGYMSWRFIEQPFRRRRVLPERANLFAMAAAASAAIVVISMGVFVGRGLPQRFTAQVQGIARYEAELDRIKNPCFSRSEADVEAGHLCVLGARDRKPSFLLWGDSHAGAISAALGEAARKSGISGYNAAFAGCPPIVATGFESEIASCPSLNELVFQRALRDDIDTVIMTEYWPAHMKGTSFPVAVEEFAPEDSKHEKNLEAMRIATFARNLEQTVKKLSVAGKRVILIMDVPEAGWPVPERLAIARRWGWRPPDQPSREAYLQRQVDFFAMAARMRDRYGAELVFPHTLLCATGTCILWRGDTPYYYDDNHLSDEGAHMLMPLFLKIFKP